MWKPDKGKEHDRNTCDQQENRRQGDSIPEAAMHIFWIRGHAGQAVALRSITTRHRRSAIGIEYAMDRTRKLPRSLHIAFALAAFAWAWLRLHRKAPQQLPARLRSTLERLGTTFVKLGQGLSLRRDVLPP